MRAKGAAGRGRDACIEHTCNERGTPGAREARVFVSCELCPRLWAGQLPLPAVCGGQGPKIRFDCMLTCPCRARLTVCALSMCVCQEHCSAGEAFFMAARSRFENSKHYINEQVRREREELKTARMWAGPSLSNQAAADQHTHLHPQFKQLGICSKIPHYDLMP